MNIKIQIIIAIGVLIALTIIINMIRRKKLELRYALVWLLVGVGILILDCFPEMLSWVSKRLGIVSPINMLFFFGFCFSLIIIFSLTMAMSRMSNRIKQLAQEMAIKEQSDKEESMLS